MMDMRFTNYSTSDQQPETPEELEARLSEMYGTLIAADVQLASMALNAWHIAAKDYCRLGNCLPYADQFHSTMEKVGKRLGIVASAYGLHKWLTEHPQAVAEVEANELEIEHQEECAESISSGLPHWSD